MILAMLLFRGLLFAWFSKYSLFPRINFRVTDAHHLQVAINDQQNRSSLADGMEHVAGLITRYAIVERIYLQISCEASEKLKNDIVSLYAATLQYLAKARKYYGKGRTGIAKQYADAICKVLH